MLEFPRDCQTEYLFHYTSIDTLINHILPTRQIRLSSFATVNDPKEYKTFILQPWRRDPKNHTETYSFLESEIWPEFKKRLKVMCLVAEPQKSSEELLNYNNRGFVNSPLWHHYADKGEGVCLVFNKAYLIKTFKERFPLKSYHSPVAYKAIAANQQMTLDWAQMDMDAIESIGIEEYVDMHIMNFHKPMFFNKAPEWAYESEYRFIVTSENKFEYLDIKGCLEGIVFGPRANLNDKKRALAIPDRRGFGNPMYKLDFRNCSPKIIYDWKE